MPGVMRMATGQHSGKAEGWTTKESGIYAFLFRSIHISSGTHQTSSAMSTRYALVERVVPGMRDEYTPPSGVEVSVDLHSTIRLTGVVLL